MSVLEDFHQKHKVRLARIASRAVKPIPQCAEPEIVPAPEPEPAPEPIKVPPPEVLDYLPGGPVRIERIVRIVSEHFGVAGVALVSARRTADLILPRHVVYYLCEQLTLHSLPAIGRRLGGRDHTTILYGIRKIRVRLLNDTVLQAAVTELIDRLGGTDQTKKRPPRKRLTEQQVREIRASDAPHVELAARFGVTHGAIWHVRTRRTWSHVS